MLLLGQSVYLPCGVASTYNIVERDPVIRVSDESVYFMESHVASRFRFDSLIQELTMSKQIP